MQKQVTRSEKREGNIIGLCGPNGQGGLWYVSAQQAINEIRLGQCQYYVQDPLYGAVNIMVVPGQTGPHLRTERDCSKGNNLDELPNCQCA